MIKVFTTNKDDKIELTKEELKALLDEAYWDGYRAHNGTYIYNTPTWEPYKWNINCNTSATNVTLSNNAIKPDFGDTDFGIGIYDE